MPFKGTGKFSGDIHDNVLILQNMSYIFLSFCYSYNLSYSFSDYITEYTFTCDLRFSFFFILMLISSPFRIFVFLFYVLSFNFSFLSFCPFFFLSSSQFHFILIFLQLLCCPTFFHFSVIPSVFFLISYGLFHSSLLSLLFSPVFVYPL
jgi:hypothetical protein